MTTRSKPKEVEKLPDSETGKPADKSEEIKEYAKIPDAPEASGRNKKNLKILKDVFLAWPNVDVLHQTSDGQCFFLRHDAVNHSMKIGGEVKTYKRSEIKDNE